MPGFTNNLVSVCKLCDADCSAYFNKTTLTIYNKAGTPGARLWRINLTVPTKALSATAATLHGQPSTTEAAKRAYDLPSTPALIEFLHATAGYPVKSTWLAAIKAGNYATWPGLTYELAARYCPDPDCVYKGHMTQTRQHIRSTKPKSPPTPTPLDSPPQPHRHHQLLPPTKYTSPKLPPVPSSPTTRADSQCARAVATSTSW